MRPFDPRPASAALALLLLGAASAPAWAGPENPASQAPVAPVMKAAQLVDVAPNHWAYQAIAKLLEKYQLMGGYPDRTFRGERTVNRYELAAILAIMMTRMEQMTTSGHPFTPSDEKVVDHLSDEFKVELRDLNSRLVQLENSSKGVDGALKDLKGKIGVSDKVHGNIGMTIEDDPQDRLKPYSVSNFSVSFGSDIDENTSYTASMTGGLAGASSGGTPVFSRGASAADQKDKGMPSSTLTIDGGADAMITTKFGGGKSSVKAGYFAPGGLMGLGGYAHHYFDGIIGSGLYSPSGNAVRTGGHDIGFGTKMKFGPVGFGAAINSQLLFGGLSMDLPGVGDVRLLADTDYNSISFTDPNLEGDPTYRLSAGLNLGSDQLGISLQGGMTSAGSKITPRGGLNFITSLFGAEICVGAALRTDSDIKTIELIPTGYVFYPSSHDWIPSILVGAHEPETISSASGGGGSGSLLGNRAGWTIQLGIPQPYLPQLKLEFDSSSQMLFNDYYGWGYAISTSTDF